MNLSCAFSIVVLFVTASNTTTASTSKADTAASTTTASTSNTTTVSNAAASSAATSKSQISAAVCIEHTCNVSGCLTNASSTRNCTGPFCKMEQRFNVNQTYYNITAECTSSCTEKDEVDGDFTVRFRCCQTDKCNNKDTQIVALSPIIGGSASNQAPLWILSIMLFISAF